MTLYKYISLRIVSLIFYLILLLTIFVFYVQIKLNTLFINEEQFFSIYSGLVYLSLVFLFLVFLEKYLKQKYSIFNFKTRIENIILQNIFILFFNIGFYLAIINIVFFIITNIILLFN